ncbi:hypothetical protein LEMLEM_LOCUS7229 [Lemmus lemmus]
MSPCQLEESPVEVIESGLRQFLLFSLPPSKLTSWKGPLIWSSVWYLGSVCRLFGGSYLPAACTPER